MSSTQNPSRIAIGILVPDYPPPLPRPSAKPIGYAVQNPINKNIRIVFGNKIKQQSGKVLMSGLTIKNDSWIPITQEILALHDRFPSQIRASHFQTILPYTKELIFGNPFEITMLCRDKIQTQIYLENYGIRMPKICTKYEEFSDMIAKWTLGFLKPQFGALGKNVQALTPSNALIPEFLEGVVPNKQEKTFIQQGIQAPKGWKGLSLRQLIQRNTDGSWNVLPAVLRRSKQDLVVNVSRGAEAVLAEEHLPLETMEIIYEQSISTALALQNHPEGQYSVEFGLDFVIDQNYQPWLIEVNSRPRGRLEVLAKRNPERFASLHQQACVAPILFLAEQVNQRN